MYDKTITLFNQYKDSTDTLFWIPTVFKNITLHEEQGYIKSKIGIECEDKARLHIRNSNLPKQYKEPIEFQKDNANSFTLASGDIFIKGEYPTVTVNDIDYSLGFLDYLRTKFNSCYEVTTVDIRTLIPHFEVGGK